MRGNEELQATTEERESTNQALARSNAELEQFAYTASHDLQAPLRAMAGFAQLLQQRYQGQLDADADTYILRMVNAASRMQELIDALLSYSRVTRGSGELASIDCGPVIDQALANLQTSIQESRTVVTRDPLPAVVANAVQLGQVFQNLIGNAIKFRREDPPRVHIRAERSGNGWLFSVQDNGIGIEPEYHERIFEVFQRLHFQVVASLLNLQAEHIQGKQALEIFQESQDRVKSMALVHERLYQSSDLAQIGFAKYVQTLVTDLFYSHEVRRDTITLKLNVDDVSLDIDTAIPCGLIINELVSNCLKRAFPAGRKGEVRVDFHLDDGNRFVLAVSDNGVGLPDDLDFRHTSTLGLQLVRTLTGQLGGAIELDRSGGTTFKVAFAAPKHNPRS